MHEQVVTRRDGAAFWPLRRLACRGRQRRRSSRRSRRGDAAAVRALLEAAGCGQRRHGRRHDAAARGRPTSTTWPRRSCSCARAPTSRRPTATASRRCIPPPSTATPAMIELLLNAGADANVALPRRRDGADDRGAHRQGRRHAGAARPRRQGQREGDVEAADGADVGGARRQRRGGEAAARSRSAGRAIARSSAGRRCSSPHGRARSVRSKRCSRPAPTSTTRCPTARARS